MWQLWLLGFLIIYTFVPNSLAMSNLYYFLTLSCLVLPFTSLFIISWKCFLHSWLTIVGLYSLWWILFIRSTFTMISESISAVLLLSLTFLENFPEAVWVLCWKPRGWGLKVIISSFDWESSRVETLRFLWEKNLEERIPETLFGDWLISILFKLNN